MNPAPLLPQGTGLHLTNSLGSVQFVADFVYFWQSQSSILSQVSSTPSFVAEPDPQGHFVFPYSGLAVHRQQDWTISVKGYGKYLGNGVRGLQPYEKYYKPTHGSPNYNVLGHYMSHGSLVFMGGKETQGQETTKFVSREASGLGSKHSRVNGKHIGGGADGWDWKKIPGTTVVDVPLRQVRGLQL